MKNNNSACRANNMATLHLIAALFVMYGHHCAVLGCGVPILLGASIQAIGVKVIFLISGYLITKSLWSIKGTRVKAILIYSIKRLGRLYPEYIMCLLVSALVIGPLFTKLTWAEYWRSGEQIMWYINWNLRMFPNYSLPGVFASNIYPNAVNGSLWTMPVELSLYILILCVFILSKNGRIRRIIFAIVTSAIVVVFLTRITLIPYEYCVWYGTDWFQALNVMPYFLIGGVAYLFNWERYTNIQLSAVLVLVFAGGFATTTAFINEMICLIVLPYFVISLMLAAEQCLSLKKLHGEYAYGMYLYGFVIQQCVVR